LRHRRRGAVLPDRPPARLRRGARAHRPGRLDRPHRAREAPGPLEGGIMTGDASGRLVVDGVDLVFHPVRREPVVALEGVDMTVEPGEFVCVVGTSGSGKSTLLRLLDGLLEPTAGTITSGGVPVRGPSPDRAMVFQSDNLLPWATVVDNVAY